MTKAKTNTLDALRTLIAERQQYEEWLATLEAKREGTPEHVFERVQHDYKARLERVMVDIRGHAEDLQLNISTLSSRLVEVAREEDTKRESLQEAELRAAVGEYTKEQWEQLRAEADRELAKIGANRASLDTQLGELRSIQKLSEAGALGSPEPASAPEAAGSARAGESASAPEPAPAAATAAPEPAAAAAPAPAEPPPQAPAAPAPVAMAATGGQGTAPAAVKVQDQLPLGAPTPTPTPSAARPRMTRTPATPSGAVRSRSEAVKPDQTKTLKCPECGTANYPTEWYCERCGGELATV